MGHRFRCPIHCLGITIVSSGYFVTITFLASPLSCSTVTL
jgi:hypothetical protein